MAIKARPGKGMRPDPRQTNKQTPFSDFPGGPGVKILLGKAGTGIDPCSEKIPYASGQLSSCTTTSEAWALQPVLHNKRSQGNKKPAHQDQRVAPALRN